MGFYVRVLDYGVSNMSRALDLVDATNSRIKRGMQNTEISLLISKLLVPRKSHKNTPI